MTGMRNKNVPDPSNLTTVSQIMEIPEKILGYEIKVSDWMEKK